MGFPAKFAESRIFRQREDQLFAAVQSALNNLGWQYQTLPNNEFEAGLSGNLMSWGENLRIEILPNGLVTIESKCVFPLQCFDWGKNKKNVQTFFAELERTHVSHAASYRWA